MSPHSKTWIQRDKYGPAHHHLSFHYNESKRIVIFKSEDNEPKRFKGLLLRVTGAEFDEIPNGFEGFSGQPNYLTHSNNLIKSTDDVLFPIKCNPGDKVKVEATMAIDKYLFFYGITGDFTC